MSCGVGRRRGSDLVWLWRRPATTALIQPLAWEPPYAAGATLEKAKRQNKQTTTKKTSMASYVLPLHFFKAGTSRIISQL